MTMSSTPATESFQWRSFSTTDMGEVSTGVEKLGRMGYFAKGLVYAIVGGTTLASTFGMAEKADGSADALRKIGQQPFGKTMLGLLAIALLGYFVWRIVQAVKDTEAAGTNPKGIVKRSGYAISGLAYAGLASVAGSIALGWTSSSGDNGSGGGSAESQVKSSLLQTTWGPTVIAIIGGIVIAVAIYFLYKGITAKFMREYDLAAMSESVRTAALYLGRTGLLMRGVAFALIGWFILQTGLNGGSGDAKFAGISDAINWLSAQPFGPFLVGTVGFGLACFGLHTMLLGYYRRFNVQGV